MATRPPPNPSPRAPQRCAFEIYVLFFLILKIWLRHDENHTALAKVDCASHDLCALGGCRSYTPKVAPAGLEMGLLTLAASMGAIDCVDSLCIIDAGGTDGIGSFAGTDVI